MVQETPGPADYTNLPAPIVMQSRSFRVEIVSDEEAGGEAAAAFVAAQVQAKPKSVLLLPTGRTPLLMYAGLVARSQNGQCDLHQVQTFNLDEFYGLSPDHPGSYHSYMQQALFDHVPIPPTQTRVLNGAAPDPRIECETYEAEIKTAGGIDLAVLGIGVNGHIGFNEPGATLDSRTRLVTIQPETRAANAFLFNNRVEDVPGAALTAGIATILEAKRILLLAFGGTKAHAITAMLHGPVTSDVPASFLRYHPDVTILADPDAAADIGA